MTLQEAKESSLYFHAKTFESIGEDTGNIFFKTALVYKNKKLDCDSKVMRIYKGEIQSINRHSVAYFEFYDKQGENWLPALETRDLYKLIHNGYVEEYLLDDPENPELFYIPIDSLIKIKTYVPSVINFTSPSIPTPAAPAAAFEVKSSDVNLMDVPLGSLTLRQLVEILSKLK